jgi:hypothetical protein
VGKHARSKRGLRYEDAARDQATRFRMIVDEIIEHNQPDQIKLRNGGGHRYQRRHLELIVYRTQMAKEFVPAWRAPQYSRPYETDAAAYYLSSAILSTKHFPEPTPKADIKWPGSDADVFMEALGHYAHTRLNSFPQLHLSDLANPAKPIEDRLVELGTQQMQNWSLRSRASGKSISMTDAFMQSYDMTRWFNENLRFKLLPHQQVAVEQISKCPTRIWPLA